MCSAIRTRRVAIDQGVRIILNKRIQLRKHLKMHSLLLTYHNLNKSIELKSFESTLTSFLKALTYQNLRLIVLHYRKTGLRICCFVRLRSNKMHSLGFRLPLNLVNHNHFSLSILKVRKVSQRKRKNRFSTFFSSLKYTIYRRWQNYLIRVLRINRGNI